MHQDVRVAADGGGEVGVQWDVEGIMAVQLFVRQNAATEVLGILHTDMSTPASKDTHTHTLTGTPKAHMHTNTQAQTKQTHTNNGHTHTHIAHHTQGTT